ncbi:MAG: hypothetical protein KBD60_04895 [Sterolibacterium sp.]|jgi:hypothetical protein|nr:hypothetical protein [Sterolibacterium sp.]
MKAETRRLALRAAAISLALHALLLLQNPWFSEPQKAASSRAQIPSISAHLATPALPRPSPSTREIPHKSATASTPLPSNPPSPRPPVHTQSTTPAPLASAVSAAEVSSHARAETSATQRPGDSEAAGLRQYRLDLAITARQFRPAPASLHSARGDTPTNIADVTHIRLSLTPETVTPTVSLDVGSGNPALDQLALNMLDRAARITPVPLTLHHKTRAVVIRVEFAADNEQSERTQGGGGDNSAR